MEKERSMAWIIETDGNMLSLLKQRRRKNILLWASLMITIFVLILLFAS